MVKNTNQYYDEIISMYNSGKNCTEIGNIVGFSRDTISKFLRKYGYQTQASKLYTTKDIDIIAELYRNDEWDKIYQLYPRLNRQRVYTLMSNNNIRKDSYFWTEDEEIYLSDNYYNLSIDKIYEYFNYRHSKKAIQTKAIKMGLTIPQEWTAEEIEILKKNYSYVPIENVMKLLPRRTYNSIVAKAVNLNIKSYTWLQEKYSDEEEQYLIDNFGKLTDEEMARNINRTLSSIRCKRANLGLLYVDKDYSNYIDLSDLFRSKTFVWKSRSMEKCQYKCILTGSSNFDVHHIVGYNTIFMETMKQLSNSGKLHGNQIDNYSKEELDEFIDIFLKCHNKYPFGVCVRTDIHKLFHRIYGSGGNTEYQWDRFIERYKNFEFDNIYYN